MAARRQIVFAAVALGAIAVAGLVARPYIRAAAFVVHATRMEGAAARAADWASEPVTKLPPLAIPWRGGTLRAYAYAPLHNHGRTVLIVPGVHASGIDEPRLVGFARDLASQGHHVLTVELPDLMRYQITPRSTDMIEDAAAWLASRPESRRAEGRIGMMGISFGGGLTIVAAGRPSLAGRVAYVLSFGGQADLPRTLHYLLTGVQPDGTFRAPHDYGVAIVTLNLADRLVPADEVEPLRAAILAFLDASRLDMYDKEAAAAQFERAKALQAALAEPARTYMRYVNMRDVAHLGPLLLPHLGELGANPALSPDRSPLPRVGVYLLHGSDDNVIPAIESRLLARDLQAQGTRVHLLLTPLITHAEVDRLPTPVSAWKLVHFWADLLNE